MIAQNKTLKEIYLDEGAKGLLILIAGLQLLLDNGVYLLFGSLILAYVIIKLQQPYKPSIFTIIFLYHFVQISANIWLSNYKGVDINFRSDHTSEATIFAYLGLLSLFLPIIYFQNKLPDINIEILRKSASNLSIQKSFRAYLIATFAATALTGLAFLVSGLTQVIFSFINIKWFFFLLFGFQVFLTNKMKVYFYAISAFEFITGFISIFSNFKTVIFFLLAMGIVFLARVYLRQMIIALVSVFLLAVLGIKWTSIKGEYRTFLNQGSSTQTVQVSREEALSKILDLAQNGPKDQSSDGVDATENFLDRLQYTFHLAKTMDRVPTYLPYEYGGNWSSILEFVFTPRALNPRKPKYEATIKTMKYTGITYAGSAQGTSFSLGYFADSYIDFGYYGMFIPLIILGFVYGGTYYYFMRKSSKNLIFNYAVVMSMFMEFTAFEMDGTYLMGRLFSNLLVYFLMLNFLFPYLRKYLSSK